MKRLILSIEPGRITGEMSQDETSRYRMRLCVQHFRETHWDQWYLSSCAACFISDIYLIGNQDQLQ